jgi:hypothetical protein
MPVLRFWLKNILLTGFISKAAKLAYPLNSAKLNFIPDFFKN